MGRNVSEKSDFSARAMHSYMLCGWRTHSEIPLTSVPTLVSGVGGLDVMIRTATDHSPIAKSSDQYIFRHSAECSFIRIEGVADFEISGGRQICVWPAAGAKQKDIEIFLFGQAWATLCHQRGILPLHASAVVTGRSITAFAGQIGRAHV